MTFRATPALFRDGYFDGAVRQILALQQPNGAIPWFDGGVFDPWNHVEAAIGLTIAGNVDAARHAYRHLLDTQLPDGSWWAQYGSTAPIEGGQYEGSGEEPRIRDTNMTAYLATGALHYLLATGDAPFARDLWEAVERATSFVLGHQYEEGDIRWSARDPHTPEEDSLLTGNASIFKSLDCAIALAHAFAAPRPDWEAARARLGTALRQRPERFDRGWERKDNFSMDWYYPVLAGAIGGPAGDRRLEEGRGRFVIDGAGCRCVEEQPWVTVAETCELALAYLRQGHPGAARDLFAWAQRWRDTDGAYWMGHQMEADLPWPAEKPAWTAGAVLIAADALAKATPAHHLFVADRPLPRASETPEEAEASNRPRFLE